MTASKTKSSGILKHWCTNNPLIAGLILVVFSVTLGGVAEHFFGWWIHPVNRTKPSVAEVATLPTLPPNFEKALAEKIRKAPRGSHQTFHYTLTANGVDMSYDYQPQAEPDIKPKTSDAPRRKLIVSRYNHANRSLRSGQVKAAAVELRFIIDTEPSFAQAHNNYGIALLRLGRFSEAEEQFRAAAQIDPTNKQFYSNLAAAQGWQGLTITPLSIRLSGPKQTYKKEFVGTFVIRDFLQPLYHTTLRDYMVGGNAPVGMAPSDHLKGIASDLKPDAEYVNISPLGIELPANPSTMPEIDFEVSYSMEPLGTVQTRVFPFVSRRDNAGHWDWYPKL